MEGCLTCSQFLTIINKGALTLGIQEFLEHFISLGYISACRLSGSHDKSILTFLTVYKECQALYEKSNSFTSLLTLGHSSDLLCFVNFKKIVVKYT